MRLLVQIVLCRLHLFMVKDYHAAHAYHQKHGGYLLSFWKDYVVCGEEYIARMV